MSATECAPATREEVWSWLDAPNASGYVRFPGEGLCDAGARRLRIPVIMVRVDLLSARHISGLLIRRRGTNDGGQELGIDASALVLYDWLLRLVVALLQEIGHCITVAA